MSIYIGRWGDTLMHMCSALAAESKYYMPPLMRSLPIRYYAISLFAGNKGVLLGSVCRRVLLHYKFQLSHSAVPTLNRLHDCFQPL